MVERLWQTKSSRSSSVSPLLKTIIGAKTSDNEHVNERPDDVLIEGNVIKEV